MEVNKLFKKKYLLYVGGVLLFFSSILLKKLKQNQRKIKIDFRRVIKTMCVYIVHFHATYNRSQLRCEQHTLHCTVCLELRFLTIENTFD